MFRENFVEKQKKTENKERMLQIVRINGILQSEETNPPKKYCKKSNKGADEYAFYHVRKKYRGYGGLKISS